MGQPPDAMWDPDMEMEPAVEMTQNEPMTTRDEPEMTRNEPTTMDTHTEDAAVEMCPLQMKAIPIWVGANMPPNLNKAGAPMGLPSWGSHGILRPGANPPLITFSPFLCSILTPILSSYRTPFPLFHLPKGGPTLSGFALSNLPPKYSLL